MDKQKTLLKNLRRIFPFLVFLLFISGVCVIVYKAQFRYDLHKPVQYIMMTTHKTNGEVILTKDSPSLTEEFFCSVPELKNFSMECTAYRASSDARISITLSDAESGQTLYRDSQKITGLIKASNSRYLKCSLDEEFTDSESRLLRLELTLEHAQDTTLHFTANQRQILVSSFNDNPADHSNVVYSLSYSDNSFMSLFYAVLCAALLLFAALAYYLIIIRRQKVQQFFVPLALMLGLIFQCLVTVHGVPDESTHLDTAYKYSNQILFVQSSDTPGTIYKRECDARLSEMLANGLESNSYYQLLFHTFEQPSDTQLVQVSYIDGTNLVPGIVYLPAALGISVGRILGLSAMLTFQLGRIFNLLVFILLIRLAIGVTPYWKNLFGALGLLPITLQQAASASYDAIINGLVFLFVALCFHCQSTQVLHKKQLIPTGVLAIFVAVIKGGVYLPLLFLLILCFHHRSSGMYPARKRKLLLGSVLAFVLLAALALVKFMPVFHDFLTSAAAVDKENSLYTIPYVLQHPLHTVYLLWNTLMKCGDDLVRGLLGGMLSWLDFQMNWIFIILLLICLLLLINVNDDNKRLSRKAQLVISGSCLLSTLLIMLSMLVGYTKMKWNYIQGLQGRYFLPLAPAIFPLLTTKMLSVNVKQASRTWMVLIGTEIILVLQIATMIL